MSTRALLRGARLVDDRGVVPDGWLLIEDDRIRARGQGDPGHHDAAVYDLRGRTVTPGFVDLHCHGGGGHSGEDGVDGVLGLAAFHRAHGTTALVVSLATAPFETMLDRLGAVRDAARRDDRILGAHLEGPFLAAAHRGAHEASLLLEPSLELADRILATAEGTLRQITLAPERTPDPVIDRFLGAGVHVAVGHTSATFAEARGAFARGASILTHTFNGMPGIHHRQPGPVVAAIEASATLEIIADGVHVDPAVVALLMSAAPGRVALVTDAITAAGAPDGDYPLGGHVIQVREGIARLGEHGSLAGSTLTLDRAVRVCVDAGVPLESAIRSATAVPARAIGERDRGLLDPGARADLVELDDQLEVLAVWSRGARS